MSNVLLTCALVVNLLVVSYAANRETATKLQITPESESNENTTQNYQSQSIPEYLLMQWNNAFEALYKFFGSYKSINMKYKSFSNDDGRLEQREALRILSDSFKPLLLGLESIDEPEKSSIIRVDEMPNYNGNLTQ